MKIAVAMSGGVDSSVAAYLLQKENHEITGITMSLWDDSLKIKPGGNSCFSPDEKIRLTETQRICDYLGIRLIIVNCSSCFRSRVIDNFISEYRSGRTPNPCVRCNEHVKFGDFVRSADETAGPFDLIATGHYARVVHNENSDRYNLLKGLDPLKDQSYFLYRLDQQQLSRTAFPLGGFTKEHIKKTAIEAGIPVKHNDESQDFFGGSYRALVADRDGEGEIVNTGGETLGYHKGIWNFTPGQRRGLGISHTEPLYVIRLDPENNRVIAGTADELSSSVFRVSDLNLISVDKITSPIKACVKLRSVHKAVACTIYPDGENKAEVVMETPQSAVSPGQSAVFYDSDSVLGGGIIDCVIK